MIEMAARPVSTQQDIDQIAALLQVPNPRVRELALDRLTMLANRHGIMALASRFTVHWIDQTTRPRNARVAVAARVLRERLVGVDLEVDDQ